MKVILAAVALVASLVACTHHESAYQPHPGMATVVTTNVPDGHCHEDDPCWVAP